MKDFLFLVFVWMLLCSWNWKCKHSKCNNYHTMEHTQVPRHPCFFLSSFLTHLLDMSTVYPVALQPCFVTISTVSWYIWQLFLLVVWLIWHPIFDWLSFSVSQFYDRNINWLSFSLSSYLIPLWVDVPGHHMGAQFGKPVDLKQIVKLIRTKIQNCIKKILW